MVPFTSAQIKNMKHCTTCTSGTVFERTGDTVTDDSDAGAGSAGAPDAKEEDLNVKNQNFNILNRSSLYT